MKSSQLFFTLLQVMFIGLKLASFISWPWYLVISPILFILALTVVYILLMIYKGWLIGNHQAKIIKKAHETGMWPEGVRKPGESAWQAKMREVQQRMKDQEQNKGK
jgi:type VI protein secretion system component VasK